MTEFIAEWLTGNTPEVTGAILGILYIGFSIRQSILTWPTGLLTSLFYIVVFFQSRFYADMALQVYYVFISIYGWFYWLKGHRVDNSSPPVMKTPLKLWFFLLAVTVLIYVLILLVLLYFTDSDVPFMDALTTALSVTATWMLAKKYIEHWLIWIFTDLISSGLYVYKNLWPTAVLFVVYTVMAVAGYRKWKMELKKQHIE